MLEGYSKSTCNMQDHGKSEVYCKITKSWRDVQLKSMAMKIGSKEATILCLQFTALCHLYCSHPRPLLGSCKSKSTSTNTHSGSTSNPAPLQLVCGEGSAPVHEATLRFQPPLTHRDNTTTSNHCLLEEFHHVNWVRRYFCAIEAWGV